ncbi:response regulator [Lederbergia lenta]|uniref:Two-component response regulator n=1 Tax=Lederbergia lenta TaxID=1467 RepID=A0A2X4ZP88_LEDLE|nr:response regulator [Lederbergia lenta]MEC2323025.1 response regulator [Lederbergia lenta]SQI62224.1 two-component response regulator [Lederbergia lenta]
MIKIMIVDDERIERKSLRKTICDEYQENVEIKEAENGRTAIMIAEEFRPDIIFMDIKMPGINGIEAAQKIKNRNSDTKFIMVTAFDTFEYAREVMKIGVTEYLLKPSTQEEVLTSLESVMNEVNNSRNKRREEITLIDNYRRALSIVQSKVITSLLMGEIDEGGILDLQDGWEQDFEKKSFAMVFDFNKEEGDVKTFTDLIQRELEQSFYRSFIGTIGHNRLPVLIQLKRDERIDTHTIRRRALLCGRGIVASFRKRFPGNDVKIGIGTAYDEIESFVHSYHEAIYALTTSTSSNSIVYYSQVVRERTEANSYPYQLENRLLEAITTGEKEECIQLFDTYFYAIEKYCNHSLEGIKQKLTEFNIVLNRQMINIEQHFQTTNNYLHTTNLLELHQKTKEELLHVTQSIQSMYHTHKKDVIMITKEYMEKNYHKPITLEEVGEMVHLSPHYFSKMFKIRTGRSFIDYLTDIRVERAKELMHTHEKNIKEICYAVGYNDPNYFSRVFKKMTGFSPSEYRQEVLSSS